ncbi:hypothetical protein BJY04DRAFT_214537 [Aspergillus karnatakaensis]|uniref:uncharacterized protein n=1 Tax=Aspergillus karnatakaensis TaxID=1810916 RepID=UPI003CCDEE59
MAYPLSITASIVGITVPTLHGVRLLLDDLQNIKDAPDILKDLRESICGVESTLASLQNISSDDWDSLGKDVSAKMTTMIENCKKTCDTIRDDLSRWTKRSQTSKEPGKLSFQDRTMIGFFKQSRIRTMSEQLQACRVTISSVVSIAILYSSLRHTHVTEEIKTRFLTRQKELAVTIGLADQQLDHLKEDSNMPEGAGGSEQKILYLSREVLQDLLKQLESTSLPATPPPRPVSTVPFRRDPDFIDQGLLEQIEQRCKTAAARVALVGFGGVGKSQLAIEYSYRIRERLPETWVFWVHASNATRFEQSFWEIAERARIPGRDDPTNNIFDLVQQWLLDEQNGQWVLILDNVDDDRFLQEAPASSGGRRAKSLRMYLPLGDHGSIIMTTRNKAVALKMVEYSDIVAVEPMNKVMAQSLLRAKLGIGETTDNLAELAQALEYMPLAMGNDNQKLSLLDHEGGQLRRDKESKSSIILAWQISFDQIQQEQPTAANFLSLMSFFDRQQIPESVLHNSYMQEDCLPQNTFEEDVQMLRNFSFISISTDAKSFEMHRLIQLATQKWLEVHGELEEWEHRFVKALLRELPGTDSPNYLDTFRSLLPHAKKAIAHAVDFAEWITLTFRVATFAHLNGRDDEAHRMLDKALCAANKVLGAEHQTTLTIRGQMAFVLVQLGKYEEADLIRPQNLKSYQKQGLHSTEADLRNLVHSLCSQGKFEEAEAVYRQALSASQQAFGEDSPDALWDLTLLGGALRGQKKREEAEALFRLILTGLENEYGAFHYTVIETTLLLGLTLVRQGKTEEGEVMCERTLAASSEVLGPNHPTTLYAVIEMGLIRAKQGRHHDAELLLQRIWLKRQELRGLREAHSLRSLAGLIVVFDAQGKSLEAEEIIKQHLETREQYLDVVYRPGTLEAHLELSDCLRWRGQDAEAEELLEHHIHLLVEKYGPVHRYTKEALEQIGKWKKLVLKYSGSSSSKPKANAASHLVYFEDENLYVSGPNPTICPPAACSDSAPIPATTNVHQN